jgi:EpsI family protein
MHAVTIVLIAQAFMFYSASHGEKTPLPGPLANLPTEFGSWKLAQVGVVDDDTRAVLKADDLMTRDYVSGNAVANLFIAYFKTQRAGQSPHSPKNCLPGAGFEPVADESGRIDVPVTGRSIHINKYVVVNGEDEAVVLYWYQSQGRVIADEFAAKFYLIEDSIRRHRSDTSLVKVVVPVRNGLTTATATQQATGFVQTFYPVVDSWLPH